MSRVFAEPYFVSPHAVQRYRERVEPTAAPAAVIDRIQAGLTGQTPRYPIARTIAVADRWRRFVAIIEPAAPGDVLRPWPAVATVWRYGLCPILLRRKRCAGGDKLYRYLNPVGLTGIPAAKVRRLRAQARETSDGAAGGAPR
jgi:hypothetical protein